MSGHAAYALVLLEDRGQFATQKPYPSGERLPPSQRESPSPLDDYLSWMSPSRLSPSRRRLYDVMVAPSRSEFAAVGKLTVLTRVSPKGGNGRRVD
jgi:hypothetical protein